MKRTSIPIRIALAVGVAALGIGAAPWAVNGLSTAAAASSASSSGGETPLPDGWELCILQGVSAPATQANVADLDEWQAEEGGSTNNTAAYNPFNTARTTDVNNAPLHEIISANGFPAFDSWISGCAATVATILQPNMTAIAAGLRAGNVSPPPAFLAVVDQSQWCAPSADGTPCYSDTILGATGSLATEVLQQSSALSVFGNVRSDLINYQGAVGAVAGAQQDVAARNQQLSAAQLALTTARNNANAAEKDLRRFAIYEYINSGLYQSSFVESGSRNSPFGTPSPQGVIAHQYSTVVASDLLSNAKAATEVAKASLAVRDASSKALQLAVLTLTSDNNTENRTLIRLVADVTALQKAGACTNAVITEPVANVAAPDGSTATGSSSSTPPTTTTTVAAVPATTTTSSTTTTTSPINLLKNSTATSTTTTSTTTTVPSTTTSTSTTTTTTTVPAGAGSGSQPVPSANPAGLQDLQGCVVALAPTGSA